MADSNRVFILSRRADDRIELTQNGIGSRIVINEDIRISIQRIDNGRVRIGIDAPDEVAILRGELFFDSAAPADSSKAASTSQKIDTGLACAS